MKLPFARLFAADDQPAPTPEAAPADAPPTETPPAPPSEEEVIAKGVAELERLEAEAGEAGGEVKDTEDPIQIPTGEETTEETNGESQSPEEVQLAQRLGEVARRDYLQRQQAAKLKQWEEQLQQQQEAIGTPDKWKEDIKNRFEADPLGTMNELGIDFAGALSSPDQDEPRSNKEIAALRERLDAMERQNQQAVEQWRQQQLEAQQQEAYNQALGRVYGVVSKDGETHEAILERGADGCAAVIQSLQAMYQDAVERGLQPGAPTDQDILHAAKVVEDVYRQQELEEIKQRAGSKRHAGVVTLGGQETKNVVPSQEPQAADQGQPPTTLTNDLQGDPPGKRKLLTDEERFEAAMKIPLPFEPKD